MIDRKKIFTVRGMTLIGVFTALCFVSNWFFQFPIATPIGITRIHFGNIFCLLSGFVLGPVAGGVAAGMGSMFFDLTSPAFINEAWITFFTKFAMAWLCGMISHSGKQLQISFRRRIAAGTSAALFYVVLYSLKNFLYNYYFLRMEWNAVWLAVGQAAIISVINGIIAVVCVLPLSVAVGAALRRTHYFGHTPPSEQDPG